MKRVTGIGGIFFKSKDPKALGAWYRDHLGLDVTDWGGAIFEWGGPGSEKGQTIWSAFKSDTTYLDPGTSSFMAVRTQRSPSQLLMPLAFAAHEMLRFTPHYPTMACTSVAAKVRMPVIAAAPSRAHIARRDVRSSLRDACAVSRRFCSASWYSR